MIDAYRLERQVATYPRVVVSPRIYSKVSSAERARRLLQDRDGVLHVNYFAELVQQAANSAQRVSARRETIHANIKRLDELGSLSQMSKWTWLKDRLEEALRA